MALNATIIKANLSISDIDHGYYADHQLTLAQHPSENTQRMMVALLGFILNAEQQPEFTKGLCATEEPALWKKNLIDDIELWIELGQPEIKKIRKACRQSKQVVIISYSDNHAKPWWSQNENELSRFDNLSVLHINTEQYQQLAQFSQRQLNINITVQDGTLWLSSDEASAEVTPEQWL